MFLIGTPCGETTHASNYDHAWPRWVVLVSGSLTCGDLYLLFQNDAAVSGSTVE